MISLKAAAVFVGLVTLGGCSTGAQQVIDAALERTEAGIKAAKDREALALKQSPCLMGVGAKNRVLTQVEKDAVESLCGGRPGLTFQDLQDLGRAMNRLQDLGVAGPVVK